MKLEQLASLSQQELLKEYVALDNQKDEMQLTHFQELEELENELTKAEVEIHREQAKVKKLEDLCATLREERAEKVHQLEASNRSLGKVNDELKEQVQTLQKSCTMLQLKLERLKAANRSMTSQLETQSEQLEQLCEANVLISDDNDEAAMGVVYQMSELAQAEASAVLASRDLSQREKELQHALQTALRLQQEQRADREEVNRAMTDSLQELERKLEAVETLRAKLKLDRDKVETQRLMVKSLVEQGKDAKEATHVLDQLRSELEMHTREMVAIFEHRQRARAHFATIRASIRFAGLDKRRRSSMNLEQIREVLEALSSPNGKSSTSATVETTVGLFSRDQKDTLTTPMCSTLPRSPFSDDSPSPSRSLWTDTRTTTDTLPLFAPCGVSSPGSNSDSALSTPMSDSALPASPSRASSESDDSAKSAVSVTSVCSSSSSHRSAHGAQSPRRQLPPLVVIHSPERPETTIKAQALSPALPSPALPSPPEPAKALSPPPSASLSDKFAQPIASGSDSSTPQFHFASSSSSQPDAVIPSSSTTISSTSISPASLLASSCTSSSSSSFPGFITETPTVISPCSTVLSPMSQISLESSPSTTPERSVSVVSCTSPLSMTQSLLPGT